MFKNTACALICVDITPHPGLTRSYLTPAPAALTVWLQAALGRALTTHCDLIYVVTHGPLLH